MDRAIDGTPLIDDRRNRDPLGLVRAYPWMASAASIATLAVYALNWAIEGDVTWGRWSLVLLGVAVAHTMLMLPFYYRVFDRAWRAQAIADLARTIDEPSERKRAEREKAARSRVDLLQSQPFNVLVEVGAVLGLELYNLTTGGAPWASSTVVLLTGPPLLFFVLRDLYRSAFATRPTAAR
ncbi:MAG: hypothetical protein O3C25_02120 [Chloroflexi bacterium]|nr:hypothetical protein [Chloroflexota bacterium]